MSRTSRMAATLLSHSVELRAGQTLLIRSTGPAGEPLARELYAQALALGAEPAVYVHLAGEDDLVLRATDDPAAWRRPNPMLVHMYDTADVILRIDAEEDPDVLRAHDPVRQEARQHTRYSLIHQQLRRLAEGTLRRCTTHYPNAGWAARAGMSAGEYEDFVFRMAKADRTDPIAAWQEQAALQQHVADALAGAQQVRISGPSIDLSFSLAGRPADNACGRQNLPDGEIDVGPVEDSVEGWVRADWDCYLHESRIADVRLVFEAGRVVEWSASSNEDLLEKALLHDDGAGRIGEIGFGMNADLAGPIGFELFDAKAAGVLSVSMGQGHVPTGSLNVSPVHWVFLTDLRAGSDVVADGRLVLEDGRPVR